MLSNKKLSILKTLAQYKFLTRLQMARIGLEKFTSAFSKHITPLLEAKYIGVLDAINYGIGHIYYLTKKGAIFLDRTNQIEFTEIHFCIKKPHLSVQTIFHRTHAINCQIELNTTCIEENVSILFYERETEALGNIKRDNNLIRKTR